MGKEPARDWTDAQAKLEEEGKCRNCEERNWIEKAHILGRKYDEPRKCAACDGFGASALTGKTCGRCDGRGVTKKLYVKPLRIVPLCAVPGYVGGDGGCHAKYDAGELDILSILSPEEQAQAVLDAGGIMNALRRIEPSMFNEKRIPTA